MEEICFITWLKRELTSSRNALLALLEKRDHLLYTEAPGLRNEYMEKIGKEEEMVLESELTTRLLERKFELIQIALNQQKPVDLAYIKQQLQNERQALLTSLASTEQTAEEIPTLNEPEKKELQANYRAILRGFHPQVTTDLTETQKELYEKALNAYKHQNIQAMRLLYEMLYPPTGAETHDVISKATVQRDEEQDCDYSLAGLLFTYFSEIETDTMLRQAIQRYTEQRIALSKEIEHLESSFPWNARKTLQSVELTQEYLAELKFRLKTSEEAQKVSLAKLKKMLGEQRHV